MSTPDPSDPADPSVPQAPDVRDEQQGTPPGIDVTIPSPARVYDYVLGGKNNFDSDRQASQALLDVLPETPLVARDNRDLVRRFTRWLVGEAGIRQLVDIGSGLPTAGNTHELAAAIADDVRVVYVDNDPIVLAHGRALLTADDHTTVIQADIRTPEDIVGHPDTRALIDVEQPLAIMIVSLLHHIPDDEDPVGIVERIKAWMPSGSYLAIGNFFDPGDDPRAPAAEAALLEGGLGTGRFRTRAEQLPYWDGLELVEPGFVLANDWHTDDLTPSHSPVRDLFAGAVGRKP